MEFKQLVMNETDTKYKEMSKGTTFVPLSQSISVVDSKSYSQKRDNYLNRLTREKNAFNSAIKEIIKTRDERLKYEKQRSLEREQQREKAAASAKLLLYWCFVIIAIGINFVFVVDSMKEAFIEVDKGGLGLPWKTLWPAWISTSIMLILTPALAIKVFKDLTNSFFIMILEVAIILVTAIVLSWSSNFIIGLIRCAVGYIVPVAVAGFIGLGICFKDS